MCTVQCFFSIFTELFNCHQYLILEHFPHPLKKATEPNVLIGCRRHIISGCRVNEPHCRSWKKAFAIFFRCVFESLFHQCVFSWKVFKLPKGQFLRFQPGLFYSCKTGKAKGFAESTSLVTLK